jgi:flagella basal body P-ring formation protein FlgA
MLRRILPLAALVLFGAMQSGAALEIPRLRQTVTVSGDVVRIGDLVDNAGSVSDVAIFRSPDVGVTGTVSAKQVLDAIRPYDLLIVDTAGVSEITVTRSGRELVPREITHKVAEALSERFRLVDADMLDITFDREPRAIYVDPQAAKDWAVERAGFDPRSGRFEILFSVPGIASAQGTVRYSGFAVEMANVATSVRPLNRGEILPAADVSIERRRKSDVPADVAATVEEIAGLAARGSLRAGQPLRRADFARPQLVKRDDLVTLLYEVPGILLTIRGKALANAAEGDTVSVLNMQSKRTIQGVVDAQGRVIVAAAAPVTVTANASSSAASQ